jgi:hypothetical protein
MMTEEEYFRNIDIAIQHAAFLMEMKDFEHLDEDTDESLSAAEERFHCGSCIVRTVMEEVWPAVEKYIDYLKDLTLDLSAPVETDD